MAINAEAWIKDNWIVLAALAVGAAGILYLGPSLVSGITSYMQQNAATNQQNQEAAEAEEYSQQLALQNALAGSTGGTATATAQNTVAGSPSPLTATQTVSALNGAGVSATAPTAAPLTT